jgi:hypothetical protein
MNIAHCISHASTGYTVSLAKGLCQLVPSDSALLSQYDSGSSSDFLVKILGVVTPLYLSNKQFYFSHSLQLLRMSHNRGILLMTSIYNYSMITIYVK